MHTPPPPPALQPRPQRPSRAFAAALVLAALAVSAPAAAQASPEQEAKERYTLGTRHFNIQEWADAAREYKAAYKLDPRIEYLWSLAQAQRLGGDCDDATRSYQAFLRSSPSPQQAEVAAELMTKCKPATPPAPPPATPAPLAPAAAPPPAPPAPAPATGAPWYADGAGHALFWTGLVGVAAGGVLTGIGNGKMRVANEATDYGTFTGSRASAEPLQKAGVTAIAVGSTLVASGVARFVVAAVSAGPGEKAAAGVSFEVRGLGAVIAGRF